MKRLVASVGLLGTLAGVPIYLFTQFGGPSWPSVRGISLTDDFLPADVVLRAVALVAWAAWLYLVVVILLRAVALAVSPSDTRSAHGVIAASERLTPAFLRHAIDVAVGGAILAAVLLPRGSAWAASPAPIAAVSVATSDVATARSQPAAPRTHIVRPGDSLWRIAERELGDGFRWREIFELNKRRDLGRGQRLVHARLIEPGWRLTLPDRRTTPTAPRANGRARALTHPHKEATVRPSTGIDRSLATRPSPSPAVQPVHPKGGPVIHLPSGAALAASFAAGLLAADALGRLRRRRLTPVDADVEIPDDGRLIRQLRAAEGDGSLVLDAALRAVRAAWTRCAENAPVVLCVLESKRRVRILLRDAGGELPPASGGAVTPRVKFSRVPSCVIAEVEGPFTAGSADPPRKDLVAIAQTSEGLLHAAPRALGSIAVTGTSGSRMVTDLTLALLAEVNPDDRELVLIDDAHELTALWPMPHARLPHRSSSLEAIRNVQTEFVRRARLFATEGVEDIDEHHERHDDDALADLLIVAAPADAATRDVLDALGHDGIRYGTSLIACGWESSSAALHLVVDGDALSIECALPLPKGGRAILLDDACRAEAVHTIRSARVDVSPRIIETPVAPSPPEINEPVMPQSSEVAGDESAVSQSAEPTGELERTIVQEPPAVTSLSVGAPSEPAEDEDLVSVLCLGPFLIRRGKRNIQKGWRSKAKEMLAYLIAHPEGAPKERLIELLWPESDLADSDLEFRRTTSAIRAQVRTPSDVRKYVVKVGESFVLEPGSWSADVWEFTRLAEQARTAPPQDQRALLVQALGLYHGDFCNDCYYSWAEPVRERLRRAFLRASARLAEIAHEAEEHDEALAVLDRAIEVDRVNEDLHRRAMMIEANVGRHEDALARYRTLEKVLSADIGVDPSDATVELARTIQATSARRAATSTAS